MKIRILLFFTIIMACEKSPLERDVEIFTDSNVKLDSMVNEHEKVLATVKLAQNKAFVDYRSVTRK